MNAQKRLNPVHLEWCRQQFDRIRDGGVWAIPRNGLVFQRRGKELVLIQRMPYQEGMPFGPDQLIAYQNSEYEDTRDHFEAAGIPVKTEIIVDDNQFLGDNSIFNGGHRNVY